MTSSAHLQLRDGVAPSALSGEANALDTDSGLSILKLLADSARANPVPALLIGAGLTMLITRTTGGDMMGVATSTLTSAAATGAVAARTAASGVAGAAASVASAAREAAGSAAGAASGVAGATKDVVMGVTDRTANAVMGMAANVTDRVAGSAGWGRQTAVDGMASVKDRVQSGLNSGKEELLRAVSRPTNWPMILQTRPRRCRNRRTALPALSRSNLS